jgi:hypothetical protein
VFVSGLQYVAGDAHPALSTQATQVSVARLQYGAAVEVHPLLSTHATQVFVARSHCVVDAHSSSLTHPTQVCDAGSQTGAGSAQSPPFVQPTQVCDARSQIGSDAIVQSEFATHWTQTT